MRGACAVGGRSPPPQQHLASSSEPPPVPPQPLAPPGGPDAKRLRLAPTAMSEATSWDDYISDGAAYTPDGTDIAGVKAKSSPPEPPSSATRCAAQHRRGGSGSGSCSRDAADHWMRFCNGAIRAGLAARILELQLAAPPVSGCGTQGGETAGEAASPSAQSVPDPDVFTCSATFPCDFDAWRPSVWPLGGGATVVAAPPPAQDEPSDSDALAYIAAIGGSITCSATIPWRRRHSGQPFHLQHQ